MMKKILVSMFLLLTAIASPAQQTVKKDSGTITVSGAAVGVAGGAFQLDNSLGMVTNGFEVVITGAPSTVSVVTKGCMRGGTCDTLDTYTTVANANRKPTISVAYDYFEISASWTGGSSPTVRVNRTATLARSGGGGVGGAVTSVFGQTGAVPDLSGDITTGGSSTTVLATVNANVGQFTKLTVNGKGLVTSATNLIAADIPAIAESGVTNLATDLAAKATTAGTLGQFAATSSSAFFGVINDETGGSGLVVGNQSPTIVTPTIASFVNANHNHSAGAGGGVLALGTAIPNLSGAVVSSNSSATTAGVRDLVDASGFCQAAGASSTTYTCNLSPAIGSYVTGTHYRFKADVANTAASTINFNALGAKTIKKAAGGITTDIVANDLRAGQWVDLVYDGTNMQLQSTTGNAAAGGAPSGSASGDLGGSYPSPTAVAAHWTQTSLVFAGSPYTVLAADTEINCNATGGNVVINLPASSGGGKNYFFIKTDSSVNTCTVTRAGADTIEGSATVVLVSQYDSLLLADSVLATWMKVSPKTPGVNGNILFNSSGIPGSVTNSVVNNTGDASGGSVAGVLLANTYTVGNASFSQHTFDATLTNSASTSDATEAVMYATLKHNSSAGTFPHDFAGVFRLDDAATGGSETLAASVYADWTTEATFAGAIPVLEGYHFDGGTLAAASGVSIGNAAAFYAGIPTFSGANITLTQLDDLRLKIPPSTNARITTFHAVNAGDCTKTSVYAAGVFCGGTTYYQSPVDITANTDANASAPMTDTNKTLFTITGTSNLAGGTGKAMDILEQSNNASGTTVTSIIAGNFTASLGNTGTNTDTVAVAAKFGSSGVVTNPVGIRVVTPTAGGTYTNPIGVEVQQIAGVGTQTNPAIDVKLDGAAGASEIGLLSTPLSILAGNRVQLTADWTAGTGGTVSSCVSACIIGSGGGVPLTFTLPKSVQNYHMHCEGVVGQATAATANSWNWLTATTGATNVTASYNMNTAATAMTGGATTDTAATTTTVVIGPTWTLGGTATKMPFHVDVMVEGAAAAGTVLSLQVVAPTVADLLTIYRGTTCVLE